MMNALDFLNEIIKNNDLKLPAVAIVLGYSEKDLKAILDGETDPLAAIEFLRIINALGYSAVDYLDGNTAPRETFTNLVYFLSPADHPTIAKLNTMAAELRTMEALEKSPRVISPSSFLKIQK